jgi:hypothetical protein
MTADDRMSWGLIWDVLGVLEAHGYHQHDEQHTRQAVAVIGDLASIYEGTHDARLTQVQPEPHDEPVAEGDQDSVILTGTEVTTIVTALDLAADYKRDCAETCADCPDQSCPACQTRLRDAQAYDQMATGMLQAAQAAQEANATQPEPGSRAIALDLAVPVADREAGQ